MSKNKKLKSWEKKWIVLDLPNKGGGQGSIHFVKNRNDNCDNNTYVLKILKRQKDQESRGRIFREAAALQTFSHTCIPKYIDSNVDLYKQLEIELYIVMEYIEGKTLQEKILSGELDEPQCLSLHEAILLTKRLVDTIKYCHEAGYVHRDIKPDNIMIRKDNSVENLVLIDFGQTFNSEDFSIQTPSNKQIGNRFLTLPEYRIDHSNKRDLRSDLALCIGILFFILTGEYPRLFTDEKEAMTHQ